MTIIDDRRIEFSNRAASYQGLGFADTPPGRRQHYLDLLWPHDTTANAAAFGRSEDRLLAAGVLAYEQIAPNCAINAAGSSPQKG